MKKSATLTTKTCLLIVGGAITLIATATEAHPRRGANSLLAATTLRVDGMLLNLRLGRNSLALVARRDFDSNRLAARLGMSGTLAGIAGQDSPRVLADRMVGDLPIPPSHTIAEPGVDVVQVHERHVSWTPDEHVPVKEGYAVDVAESAATSVTVVSAPPVFSIKPGEAVSVPLAEFAKAHGWQLSWDADEYIVSTSVRLAGTLDGVIDALIRALNHSGARLKSTLYDGNKTLRISERN